LNEHKDQKITFVTRTSRTPAKKNEHNGRSLRFFVRFSGRTSSNTRNQRKSEETVEAAAYTGSAAPMAFQKTA
jgi:hypothetical protein